MNKELYLFPVHIAMLVMAIGFGIFFIMIFWDLKRTVKRTRKYKRKAVKFALKIKRKIELRKNWYYEI